MERVRVDPQEVTRQLEEDFLASQNMIGEGAPDFSSFKDDDAVKELQKEEQQAENLQ